MVEPIRVLHILQRMESGGTQALLMNIYRKIDRTKVACFLLSDASKCISGEVIHCNAGNHLKAFWEESN